MSDYTVTIAGPERHDGESPFTFVVEAKDEAEAVSKALETMRLYWPDKDDFVLQELWQGVPLETCGYCWNDLREGKNDGY